MRLGIVSQARMTSTRLPGKVLLEAGGRPLLAYHVDRLRASGAPVYLAITDRPTDDPIATWADTHGVAYVRGSEDDVLSRYGLAAASFELDVIVRVTSDCPLIDGGLVAEGIRRYISLNDTQCYLSNTLTRTYPRGMDFEIFGRALLEQALLEAVEAHEREHVTPIFYREAKAWVHLEQLAQARDDSAYRLTVDEPADYQLIRTLIETHGAAMLSALQLADLLRTHPDLATINASVGQKPLLLPRADA